MSSNNQPKIELFNDHPFYGRVKYTISWNLGTVAKKSNRHVVDIGTVTVEKPEPEIINFDDAKDVINRIKKEAYKK